MNRLFVIINLVISIALAMPSEVFAQHDNDDVIEQALSETPAMKAVDGGIEFISGKEKNAKRFNIYSITGQMIKTLEVSDSAKVELPKGFYIVKCDDWSKRIIVR